MRCLLERFLRGPVVCWPCACILESWVGRNRAWAALVLACPGFGVKVDVVLVFGRECVQLGSVLVPGQQREEDKGIKALLQGRGTYNTAWSWHPGNQGKTNEIRRTVSSIQIAQQKKQKMPFAVSKTRIDRLHLYIATDPVQRG